MDNNYWLSGWQNGKTGFHRPEVNRALIKYFDYLEIKSGARIFVPLCGKSLDMLWLKQQGLKVTGVELSPIACQDFFNENNLHVTIDAQKDFISYCHQDVEIFCGDFFNFKPDKLFPAIYDRAALVALLPDMRKKYMEKLARICEKNATLLLVGFESDFQPLQPPFPITLQEMNALCENFFVVTLLAREAVTEAPLIMLERGHKNIKSSVYLLRRTSTVST